MELENLQPSQINLYNKIIAIDEDLAIDFLTCVNEQEAEIEDLQNQILFLKDGSNYELIPTGSVPINSKSSLELSEKDKALSEFIFSLKMLSDKEQLTLKKAHNEIQQKIDDIVNKYILEFEETKKYELMKRKLLNYVDRIREFDFEVISKKGRPQDPFRKFLKIYAPLFKDNNQINWSKVRKYLYDNRNKLAPHIDNFEEIIHDNNSLRDFHDKGVRSTR